MPEFMQNRSLAAAIFVLSSILPPLCLGTIYVLVYVRLRQKGRRFAARSAVRDENDVINGAALDERLAGVFVLL